jgi:hypothetical protein
MSEEKEPTGPSGRGPGASKEEVALELMRFIAQTTGYGKTSTGAGFAGKAARTPDEQADALLQLFERCRAVVEKK